MPSSPRFVLVLTSASCRPKVFVANIVSSASSVAFLKNGKLWTTKIAALHQIESYRMTTYTSTLEGIANKGISTPQNQARTHSSTTRWSISITGSFPCLVDIVFVMLYCLFQICSFVKVCNPFSEMV